MTIRHDLSLGYERTRPIQLHALEADVGGVHHERPQSLSVEDERRSAAFEGQAPHPAQIEEYRPDLHVVVVGYPEALDRCGGVRVKVIDALRELKGAAPARSLDGGAHLGGAIASAVRRERDRLRARA